MKSKLLYIPEELRAACSEANRLRREGKPIPDDIRKKSNEYKSWLYHKGKPQAKSTTRKPKHDYIPKELREAHAIFSRKIREGVEPTEQERAMANEYRRYVAFKGKPPKKQSRSKIPPDKPYHAEYLEWRRLAVEGVAPGDRPLKIAEGQAKYNGKPVPKYTKCEDSEKTGSRCCGRHGKGSKKFRAGPGRAYCMQCVVVYEDVPADVKRCGCCGGQLRKSPRDKRSARKNE